MKVLLLHKYDRKAASYRHRLEQYLPYLQAAGHECTVSALLGDDYLSHRFETGWRGYLGAARSAVRRLGLLTRARRYDVVVICIELFPYFPAIFERLLTAAGVPYVYDFDDPIFHYYDMSRSALIRRLLSGKIRSIAAGASVVFAGSPCLFEYASKVNPRTELLPTVIDLKRYPRVKQPRADAVLMIGWIGSPSTAHYVVAIAPALRRFCAERMARLVMIGSGPLELPGVPLEVRSWSEDGEVEEMLGFDLGIMPLTDDPWSRGKCGFKLIQYMACGLPTIASPVGANASIVRAGETGLFASSESEWVEALSALADSPALRARLGQAGRERVEGHYCVQVTARRFIEGVERAAGQFRGAGEAWK